MTALSRVGLGTNNFGRRLDLEGARAVVDAAIDAGVTHIDTADIYGGGESERYLGEILAGRLDRVVLATKFGMGQGGNGSPEYVHKAIDASLAQLRTDRVDLFYYHRPDGVTPIGETVAAMHELVEAGKVRQLGVSNVDAAQLRDAAAAAPVGFVQNRYSLLERGVEAELLPLCSELGVGFVPYFPLASGLLTGKYRRGEPAPAGSRLEGQRMDDETFDRIEALERFAARHGHTLLELAIGALASQPAVVSVIAGAMTPEQVRANAAAGSWRLTPEELAAIP
ncbi:MAG: aldo/keto reductase [Actinomycetota bacterium]|nr:aldo/keto reductase [Actinomycetota bacterium]